MARQNEIRYVNMYMAGSAAYQLEPAQQKKRVKLPKAPKKQKLVIHVDPLTMIGFVVAFVMIIAMTVGVVSLNSAMHEAAVMEDYVNTLEQKNAQLEEQYRSSYDLEEIRKYALAIGMVPVEQAERVSIRFEQPPVEEEVNAWEDFWVFLTGLFA